MKVVTGAEMRKLDQVAINDFKIPGIVLMENAGLRVVETVTEYFAEQVAGKKIIVIAGKGNNGGDGLVIARHLHGKQARVKVFLAADPAELQGDAAVNMAIVSKMGIPVHLLKGESDLTRLNVTLSYSDLAVDALFGTGFQGVPRGMAGQVIETVNKSAIPVVAVDIPSGLEADSGKIKGQCIRADITVTLALPKLGLLVEPGAGAVGRLVIGDIGIPGAVVERAGLKMEMPTAEWCGQQIVKRQSTGHKGSYGHVLIVGGSRGMLGAPVLAARAALRSGAGLVTAAVPQSLQSAASVQVTEALTAGLPETPEGSISPDAAEQIVSLATSATAIVIGPGLARSERGKTLLETLLPKIHKPLVLDADALALIAQIEQLQLPRGTVLTPHPGEMGRLLGCSTGQIQADRIAAVNKAAQRYQATVVLKGARSLTCTPQGLLYVNTTGNPGMATGGSGDVLAGMIGALLAQGLILDKAAACAVFLHGWAGDLWVENNGAAGLVAGDLVEQLPAVLHRLGR